MTEQKQATSVYRKVWLPTEIREAVSRFCETNGLQASPLVGSLIEEIVEDPTGYEDSAVPPAGPNYISVYVSAELWNQGIEVAHSYGVSLGAMLRVGLARRLAEQGIPWDVTTVRPRNSRIPIRE
jgi:hypothetical protein